MTLEKPRIVLYPYSRVTHFVNGMVKLVQWIYRKIRGNGKVLIAWVLQEYEEDDENENDDDNDDVEVVISGEPTEVVTDTTAVVVLETVVEEDDDDGDQQLNLGPVEFVAGDGQNVEPQISNSPVGCHTVYGYLP